MRCIPCLSLPQSLDFYDSQQSVRATNLMTTCLWKNTSLYHYHAKHPQTFTETHIFQMYSHLFHTLEIEDLFWLNMLTWIFQLLIFMKCGNKCSHVLSPQPAAPAETLPRCLSDTADSWFLIWHLLISQRVPFPIVVLEQGWGTQIQPSLGLVILHSFQNNRDPSMIIRAWGKKKGSTF